MSILQSHHADIKWTAKQGGFPAGGKTTVFNTDNLLCLVSFTLHKPL